MGSLILVRRKTQFAVSWCEVILEFFGGSLDGWVVDLVSQLDWYALKY